MKKFEMMIKKENVNYVEIFKTCDEETRRNYMYNILLNDCYRDGFMDVVNQYMDTGTCNAEEAAKSMSISMNSYGMLVSYDTIMRYDKAVFYYVDIVQEKVIENGMFVMDRTFKDLVKSDYIMSVVRAILEAIGYKVWHGFIDIFDFKEGGMKRKCPTYIITNPDKKGEEVLENLIIIEKSRAHF